MEAESFENEEVAKLLNDWFVSVKVSSRIDASILVVCISILFLSLYDYCADK